MYEFFVRKQSTVRLQYLCISGGRVDVLVVDVLIVLISSLNLYDVYGPKSLTGYCASITLLMQLKKTGIILSTYMLLDLNV